jgi:hypothetical protein
MHSRLGLHSRSAHTQPGPCFVLPRAGTRILAPFVMVRRRPLWTCGGHGRGCGRADHDFRDRFVIVVGVVWSVVGSGLTNYLKVSNTHS